MELEYDLQRNLHNFLDLSEPHWHETLEILVCLSDGGHFMLKDNLLPLRRGMVFIIEKGSLHRCVVEVASYDRYILHISYETLWLLSSPGTDLLALLKQAGGYTTFSDKQLEEISVLLDQCLKPSEEFAANLAKNIALMQVILYLARHLNSDQSGIIPTQSKDFTKIIPILNYIRDNYQHEIFLDEISNKFFISKYYLCRLFKETTGFSVGNYITNYRIRQACIALRKKASVQEAGESAGFTNNANFIRTFKQIVGITPGKYSKYYDIKHKYTKSPGLINSNI